MTSTARKLLLLPILASLVSAAGFSQSPSPRMLDGLSREAAMGLANAWGMKADENKMNIWTNSRAILLGS